MSVGIGLGLVFLAREGISFAILKRIPKVSVDDVGKELEADEPMAEAPSAAPEPQRV